MDRDKIKYIIRARVKRIVDDYKGDDSIDILSLIKAEVSNLIKEEKISKNEGTN